MQFQKSTKSDIISIMKIINQAQDYLKCKGINQWQNQYPNHTVINQDVENGESYVLIKNHQVIGTMVLSFEEEKNYLIIEEGDWLTRGDYAVIHRVAVDNDYKGNGILAHMIKEVEKISLEKKVSSIRVDTHADNLSMQKALIKNGFQYCGIIYLDDLKQRMAFEKVLTSE